VSALGVTRATSKGDQNYLIGTGPAATQVFNLSSDGLVTKSSGLDTTALGHDSLGTIMFKEENFQASSDVGEAVKPDGTQTEYTSGTTGADLAWLGKIRVDG